MGGIALPNHRLAKPVENPLKKQYGLYGTAVEQQAGDYDTIMGGYKNLLNSPLMNEYQNVLNQMRTGGQATFQDTPDARRSISNLGELSRTGGLSDRDQANLRARGISPIRAIYGNAQRNINRQRALGGGYSPNYTAATTKMARDLSSQIADKTTDVNAGIAEMVQRGRLSASPQYASAAGAERGERNTMEMFNKRDLPNMQTNVINSMAGLQSDALRGMSSLYGTTPALSKLFGDQAMQGAQFQNQVKQQKRAGGMQLLGTMMRGGR